MYDAENFEFKFSLLRRHLNPWEVRTWVQLGNEGRALMENKKMIETCYKRFPVFTTEIWGDICLIFILDAKIPKFTYVTFEEKLTFTSIGDV